MTGQGLIDALQMSGGESDDEVVIIMNGAEHKLEGTVIGDEGKIYVYVERL